MPSCYVVGVDQSANHTGVAVLTLEGDLVLSTLVEPGKRKGLDRLVYVRDTLRSLLLPYEGRIEVAVWESYSMGSTNMPFLLGEIGGTVQLVLHDLGVVSIKSCAPKALKKFITGNAAATKEDMMAKTRIGEDNRADAYGLAQVALELATGSTSTVRAQREVVANITRPKAKQKRSFRANKGML
jgi:Holliday junction resolvasome RuvABC endonuclease subunit